MQSLKKFEFVATWYDKIRDQIEDRVTVHLSIICGRHSSDLLWQCMSMYFEWVLVPCLEARGSKPASAGISTGCSRIGNSLFSSLWLVSLNRSVTHIGWNWHVPIILITTFAVCVYYTYVIAYRASRWCHNYLSLKHRIKDVQKDGLLWSFSSKSNNNSYYSYLISVS